MSDNGDPANRFREIFDRAVTHIEQSYIDRDFVRGPWPGIRSDYQKKVRKLTGEASFHQVMEDLVGKELKLSHTDFITPEKSLYIEQQESGLDIPDALRLKHTYTADYLYVKLPTFQIPLFGFAPVSELLRTCGKTRRVILDVRLQSGGSISAAGEVLGLLIGADKPFCRSRLAGWEDETDYVVVYPQPEELNHGGALDIPIVAAHRLAEWRTSLKLDFLASSAVIVLVGGRTYSCGEIFVQALKEYGRAVVMGSVSAGAVVAARDDFDCGAGYRLLLPFAELISAGGIQIEGRGVIPDVEYSFECKDTELLSEKELESIMMQAETLS